jgi:hypothetical protein
MTNAMSRIVRITDLANPEYTEAALVALKEAEARPIELTVEPVLATARSITGLADFGRGDFRERMAIELSEVDRHPYNTAWGRADFFDGMVHTAANRLRILNLLKLHPEIEELEVNRPIFIVGMPRTGTTDLVNAMAADSRFRTMPNWEGEQLVPDDPEQHLAPDEEDPRLVKARRTFEERLGLLPYRELMHPTNPDFLDEAPGDGPDFPLWGWGGTLAWLREMLNWREDSARWRGYLQPTPPYTWTKKGIKILQWYRPGERFLGKLTGHMEKLGALMQQFPDATVVFTHRDPVAVVQSAATMICYRSRMYYTRIDPAWYLDFYKGLVHHLLRAHLQNRDLVPEKQRIDVVFDKLIANQMGILEEIYRVAGLPLTEASRAEIEHGRSKRARGFVPWEQGKVAVDLRADYGVDPVSIRREFDYYFNALPVRPEVS